MDQVIQPENEFMPTQTPVQLIPQGYNIKNEQDCQPAPE